MTSPGPASAPRRTGKVLVVDDHASNRLLARELLEADGHHVTEAVDGPSGLAMVAEHSPDIVLLDVQMPGVDGFEVCRRLKADPRTAAIPVVLLTALAARDDRIAGIRAGANDFLSKPIDRTELLLRVGNAVALYSMYVASLEQYRTLQEMESMRDALVHLMVHDLRSPLTVMVGNLELARTSGPGADPEIADLLDDAMLSARRMADMVSDMLDVSRMEEGKLPVTRSPVDITAVIAEAVRLVAVPGVRVVHDTTSVSVVADPHLVLRVITNLLDNAIKFTPPGGTVTVSATLGRRGVTVAVGDEGPGVPPEARATIFDKFSQVRGVKQPRRSSGLGLAFCKLAVEAHGGEIDVESDGTNGSTFWFVLPPA